MPAGPLALPPLLLPLPQRPALAAVPARTSLQCMRSIWCRRRSTASAWCWRRWRLGPAAQTLWRRARRSSGGRCCEVWRACHCMPFRSLLGDACPWLTVLNVQSCKKNGRGWQCDQRFWAVHADESTVTEFLAVKLAVLCRRVQLSVFFAHVLLFYSESVPAAACCPSPAGCCRRKLGLRSWRPPGRCALPAAGACLGSAVLAARRCAGPPAPSWAGHPPAPSSLPWLSSSSSSLLPSLPPLSSTTVVSSEGSHAAARAWRACRCC